jgi:hypothetical protein
MDPMHCQQRTFQGMHDNRVTSIIEGFALITVVEHEEKVTNKCLFKGGVTAPLKQARIATIIFFWEFSVLLFFLG